MLVISYRFRVGTIYFDQYKFAQTIPLFATDHMPHSYLKK